MDVDSYLAEIGNIYFDVLQTNAVAIYIGGSYCQSDFGLNSDLDIYAFCDSATKPETLDYLARQISNAVLEVPAKGLEFCVVEMSSEIRREPEFLLVLSDGKDWNFEVIERYKTGENLIGLKIIQESGRLIRGLEIAHRLPVIPREWLVEEVRKVVDWHKSKVHDTFHDPQGFQAVLNACRALCYFETGRLVSKTQGGEWFANVYPNYRDLVAKAIRSRVETSESISKRDIVGLLVFIADLME